MRARVRACVYCIMCDVPPIRISSSICEATFTGQAAKCGSPRKTITPILETDNTIVLETASPLFCKLTLLLENGNAIIGKR